MIVPQMGVEGVKERRRVKERTVTQQMEKCRPSFIAFVFYKMINCECSDKLVKAQLTIVKTYMAMMQLKDSLTPPSVKKLLLSQLLSHILFTQKCDDSSFSHFNPSISFTNLPSYSGMFLFGIFA